VSVTKDQYPKDQYPSVNVEPTPVGQIEPVVSRPRPWRGWSRWLHRLLHNRKATVGATILLLFIFTAIFAPVIAPGDPTDFVARPHLPPSSEHWFGTTGQGQDVFSQTVWGTRISLGIGLLVGVLTTIIGAAVGVTAGYFGHRVDDALSLVMNVFLIIPSLPLLVTLAAFLPPGPVTIVLVLTFTAWAWPARVLRSQTLSLREKDFVSAAEVSGESRIRIMFREILPNMMSLVVAGMFGSVIYAIGAEAGLEFLGLGNVSTVTWGTNLYWATNNAGLLTGAWWTFVPSGLAIALVAFGFALMNYAMDEITNPRLRAHGEIANVFKQRSIRLPRGRATPVLKRTG
jgi:peptide/nickel transport system permease protein